jgi:hypothetical protein
MRFKSLNLDRVILFGCLSSHSHLSLYAVIDIANFAMFFDYGTSEAQRIEMRIRATPNQQSTISLIIENNHRKSR